MENNMNNIPGIKGDTMKLYLSEDYFKKNPAIEFMQQLKWYWRMIGFYIKFQSKVLGDPTNFGDSWKYTTQLQSKTLYWLGIKLKVIKYGK